MAALRRRQFIDHGMAAPSRRFLLAAGAATMAIAALPRPSRADGRALRLGLSGAISSVDPHFAVLSSNNSLSLHFFDPLVSLDVTFRPQPALALSWAPVEPTVWEFRLRPGVRFNDGSAFGAEDVVASFARAPNVPNSPSSFRTYTSAIQRVEAVDAMTVRIHTNRPDPTLPAEVAEIMIIPRALRNAATADFNAGPAMIGTGPYRMTEYQPGNSVGMVPNPSYWGRPQPWSRVAVRIVTSNPSRTAGLLAGDLDLIDYVGPSDVPALKASSRVRVAGVTSIRVIFIMLDQGNDVSPDISGHDGRPLDRNPLKDQRVRLALSLAINRTAITERLMSGQAVPAGQILSGPLVGVSPRIAVPPFDPAKSKQLLAEAGYPDGFRIVIRGPNDRYLNDADTVQAVAQMFSRIGLDARVEVAPWVAFRPLIGASNFSAALFGWASNVGETGLSLNALLGTQDAKIGRGLPNGGRYSNPKFDALVAEASTTLDTAARGALLDQAIELAMAEVALIPLFFPIATWGYQSDMVFAPNPNEYTTAMQASPA